MFTRLWVSYSSWTKSEFFFVISTSKRKEHTQKNRFLVHIGSYRYCIGCSHMVTESSHVNVISFFNGLDQGNIWNPLDSMAKTRVSSWETHRFPMDFPWFPNPLTVENQACQPVGQVSTIQEEFFGCRSVANKAIE